MSKLPLSRFRVIDLTRVRAGPTCVRQLADFGADVVKIEATGRRRWPRWRAGKSDFQNLASQQARDRNRLETKEGVDLLKRMASAADVLVENYRPDVKI